MFRIVDVDDAAKWFPPSAFNLAAWAAACGVGVSTIDEWLKRCDPSIVVRPGGPRGERFVAVEDFWPAVAAGGGNGDAKKPGKRRG